MYWYFLTVCLPPFYIDKTFKMSLWPVRVSCCVLKGFLSISVKNTSKSLTIYLTSKGLPCGASLTNWRMLGYRCYPLVWLPCGPLYSSLWHLGLGSVDGYVQNLTRNKNDKKMLLALHIIGQGQHKKKTVFIFEHFNSSYTQNHLSIFHDLCK